MKKVIKTSEQIKKWFVGEAIWLINDNLHMPNEFFFKYLRCVERGICYAKLKHIVREDIVWLEARCSETPISSVIDEYDATLVFCTEFWNWLTNDNV